MEAEHEAYGGGEQATAGTESMTHVPLAKIHHIQWVATETPSEQGTVCVRYTLVCL